MGEIVEKSVDMLWKTVAVPCLEGEQVVVCGGGLCGKRGRKKLPIPEDGERKVSFGVSPRWSN